VSSFYGQNIFPPIQIQQQLIELCGGECTVSEIDAKNLKTVEQTSTMMIARSAQHTKATRKRRMSGGTDFRKPATRM
jgi:hypothetical protein